MTYTSAELDVVLGNLSGSLPSSLFEEYIDSFAGTIAQQDSVVLTHRCVISTNIDEYIVFPFAGTVTAVYSVINQTIATNPETIVFKNGSDALGTITIASLGSNAGDVDSLTIAGNASFTAGEFMLMEIGGESTNDAQCDIVIVYQRTA